jgi:hypothetical protein
MMDYGDATLNGCTIGGNTTGNAGRGSGAGLDMIHSGDVTELTDTIVADNDANGAASDISDAGGDLTGSHCLIGIGGSGGLADGTSGNIVLTSLNDLDLGPLANNVGQTQAMALETQTMALLPGSVAIHAGIAVSGVTTDQRGEPLDSPPDIGAYQAQAAAATTEAAAAVTSTAATLNASVDPEGSDTRVSFVYGTSPTLATGTTATPAQDIGDGTGSVAVSAALAGLAPGTTYYYRVVAANFVGPALGAILDFTTTIVSPPVATTQAATAVTSTTAMLNASVDPEGSGTTASFVYGTDPSLLTGTTTTAGQSSGGGTSSVWTSAALTGLAPGTTYYYRVEAASAGGMTDGAILSFTTAAIVNPPAAATQPATAVASATATLNAAVDPEGSATTVSFLYGTDPRLSAGVTMTPGQSSGNGTGPVSMSVALSGLSPGTTYYYRVVATNAGETTFGAILEFSTNPAPPPPPAPVEVTGVGWQTEKIGRRKSIKVLDVSFSGALNAGDATNTAAYMLDATAGTRKHPRGFSIPLPFGAATYSPATYTVQLTPIGKIPNRTMELTIDSGLVRDAEGRPLDGNHDGQPGGDFVATLNRAGVISMARTMVEAGAGRVTAMAVDALTADGSLDGLMRRDRAHRLGTS